MAGRTKRVIKKAISWAGLFFFGVAAYMLYRQLSKYSLEDIKDALFAIPSKNLILACIASFLGYVALSSYDFLALKYIGHKLSAWKWIFAGVIGFSVSNNAGHAIVSGGTIRYRLYTRWRFKGSEIVRMVTFSGFTYLVACFFLIIVGYVITPDHAFGEGSVSRVTTEVVALCSVIGLLGYFGLSIWYKKPLVIKGIELDMPRPKMALAQVFIGAADILMASLVLYFPLIAFVDIPFDMFMGVFIIAQVLGVFSQVPGGLGVFEGLFMYIIPGEHNQALLFGALLAYRIIYYLLPLVIWAIALFSYENYLKYKKKKKIEKIKLFRMHEMNKE
ncbi:MAG: lysylphosphatidylglycerol synthase domain-containing protein [Alphaproteobacteria bacterium]|nr:lysylphosphatidylglycerol synthase domain-containing protein [Alphaproteobacteria bacterium]